MDITAGAGRNRTEKISCHDRICIGAADPAGRFRRDPAGPVGAEPAADALKPEGTFCFLSIHPMMRCLQRQALNIALQRLVRAFAGIAAITLIHFISSYIFLDWFPG